MLIQSSESKKHWWVIGSERNPKRGWHWDYFFRDPRGWRWPGTDWIKSARSLAHIGEMRKGDIIVAYQAGEGIIGLVYLNSDGYPEVKGGKSNRFDMKSSPVVRLRDPVPYCEIRDLPGASKHIEFVGAKVKQASVFSIDATGFRMIIASVKKFNPRQSKEIDDFLK